MSKQREALQMALEALEKYGTPRLNNEDAYSAAIKTIREALAEPEQEPVAWMLMNDTQCHIMATDWKPEDSDGWKTAPLYTAPPARKPLTDEQITAVVQSMSAYTWDAHMLARLIEKAHGIGDD